MTGCFQSKSLGDKIPITKEKKGEKNLGDFGLWHADRKCCERLIENKGLEMELLMWK